MTNTYIMMNEFVNKCVSFILIFLNFLIRSICPSQYVPYQRTCSTLWGDPYFARVLATFAEFAFYRQVTRSLEIDNLWINITCVGVLLILWLVAECVSWIGLVFQSYEANALEDTLWCVWFIVAFVYSKQQARHILIPIILYYICCHLPSLIFGLANKRSSAVQKLASQLDSSGSWVVPSVVAKLMLYILFVCIEVYNTKKETNTPINLSSVSAA